MLSSTKEYIEALRAGKYLRFLEWPYFVVQHYNKEQNEMGADALVPLLLFELLNNGFCEEDIKKVALIDAVSGLISFQGKLNYSLIVIASAVFEYMVYDSKGLKHRFILEDNPSRDQILKFMKHASSSLELSAFNDEMALQQNKFFDLSKRTDPKLLEDARRQISAITAIRDTLQDYIFSLKASAANKNQLQISRLSMAARLADYLGEQTELTPAVTEEIAEYVNKIRLMQPVEYELMYLNSISPLSVIESTWQYFSSFSIGFFKLLQKPEPKPESKPSIPFVKENGL